MIGDRSEFEQIGCLLSYGPKRPDWSENGAPTRKELAIMMWHKRANDRGRSRGSAASAPSDQHVSVPPRPKLPRPPNMSDDELPVGVYRASW